MVESRQSQVELRNHIELLSSELEVIAKNQHCPVDLECYVKKLVEARKRITIVNTILQNSQVLQCLINKSSTV